MKKLILLLVYCAALSFSIAQDNDEKNVWAVTYMKPKADNVAQFEKGLADHVEKHHPADGWPEYHFKVVSGPNLGMYIKFSGPHSWKSFDERVRSQADMEHSRRYIRPHLDLDQSYRSSEYWVYSKELSYNPAMWNLAHLSYNYTAPGSGNDYIEFLEGFKKAKTISKSDQSHEIYKVVSGKNPDTWVWAYPMNKMEDMSSTASLGGGGGFLQDALGKNEADRINDIYQKVTKSRMRQVIKFQPELSTSIENVED